MEGRDETDAGLLGVSEGRFGREDVCNIPPDFLKMLSWETDLFADLEVCPFTSEREGVMQLVCVESAANVVIR